MRKLWVFVSVALCHALAMTSADITDGTDLVMAFMVHRHGDRTPVEFILRYSTDPEEVARLSKPYGYEQLTDKGKRRSYQMGKFIRNRYNDLLGTQYNESNVFIRSTDVTRTKMTILTALAAIYPPGLRRWSTEIDWTPVPYTTVPSTYDYNTAFLNCPVLVNSSNEIMVTDYPEFRKYKDVLMALTVATNQDIVNKPVMAYIVSDAFDVQTSLGVPLPSYIQAIEPEIREVAAKGLEYILSGQNAALQAGVLLEEFYHYSNLAIAGSDTPRFRLLSAHDYNVFAFEIVTGVTPLQRVPKYNSLYALELRRIHETGQFIVVPVYLPQPGEDVVLLTINGCGEPCYYDKFVEITKNNSLTFEEWMKQCGTTSDVIFNM